MAIPNCYECKLRSATSGTKCPYIAECCEGNRTHFQFMRSKIRRGDRIRHMKDEELADLIASMRPDMNRTGDLSKFVLAWLQEKTTTPVTDIWFMRQIDFVPSEDALSEPSEEQAEVGFRNQSIEKTYIQQVEEDIDASSETEDDESVSGIADAGADDDSERVSETPTVDSDKKTEDTHIESVPAVQEENDSELFEIAFGTQAENAEPEQNADSIENDEDDFSLNPVPVSETSAAPQQSMDTVVEDDNVSEPFNSKNGEAESMGLNTTLLSEEMIEQLMNMSVG